jgi:ABC-type nitrate/sulfonate/bicarbonate transport system substrate-binding protein
VSSGSFGLRWPRRAALTRPIALVAVLAIAVGCSGRNSGPDITDSPGPLASAAGSPSASVEPSATASSSVEPSTSESPSVAPSVVPSASPSATVTPPLETVRLALDWTPNTNHTGFFVADAKGWYADSGVALKVIAYSNTAPETLLTAGQANCGISFQDSLTFAVAAGAPIRSVMAILQHSASAIAVLASGPIARPRDLDGRTYGGFGYPADDPTIRVVIKHDGGKGVFKDATLNASAYEALYAKQVDFTIVFTAWEGIEASQRGIALRYFRATDYGFPDYYQVVLACNTDWLKKHADLARRFVAATVRGFELATSDPADAAAILIAKNPGIFDANPKLPQESAAYLAKSGLYVNTGGLVGPQTLQQWTAYSSFLYREGLLSDANGTSLTAPPDYAALFTNEFLPGGP